MTNPLPALFIDYPVEKVKGSWFQYRCRSCKKLAKDIQGKIENHAADCEYRRSNPRPSIIASS